MPNTFGSLKFSIGGGSAVLDLLTNPSCPEHGSRRDVSARTIYGYAGFWADVGATIADAGPYLIVFEFEIQVAPSGAEESFVEVELVDAVTVAPSPSVWPVRRPR